MIGKIDSRTHDASVSKPQTSKQSVKTSSSSSPPSIPRAVSSLAASGLPNDKLSASIISFARFFSLPLKPQVLADIRRQALSPPLPQPSQNAANTAAADAKGEQSAVLKTFADAKSLLAANSLVAANSLAAAKSFAIPKGREALSLAAAAAESKGVELQSKALESYAEAVDPDSRRQNDSRQRRQRDREKNEQEEKELTKAGYITSEFLKKTAFEYAQNDPLLDILNKLPGKNGQRWIVLPFDFSEGDRDYFVSMRILLEDVHAKTHRTASLQNAGNCSNHVIFMALDVVSIMRSEELGVRCEELEVRSEECGVTSKEYGVRSGKREVFVLEFSGEKISKVSVCVWQEMTAKEQHMYKAEVSKVFDVLVERVNLRICGESFPFEGGYGENLPSIDEAV